MTGESAGDDTLFSPEEMKRGWLRVEMSQVRLAAERRIKEATAIVDGYAAGKYTREQANILIDQHEAKWGAAAKDPAIAGEIHDEALNRVFRLRAPNRQGDTNRSR